MNRRLFIGTALLPFTMPPGILAAGDSPMAADMAFFDPRFSDSAPALGDWVRASAIRAVNGDVTQVWNEDLKCLSGKVPLTLAGVTTESFYFCLQYLLQEKNTVTAETLRINRNLFAWVIANQNQKTMTEMS
jgi:hypothetical protein